MSPPPPWFCFYNPLCLVSQTLCTLQVFGISTFLRLLLAFRKKVLEYVWKSEEGHLRCLDRLTQRHTHTYIHTSTHIQIHTYTHITRTYTCIQIQRDIPTYLYIHTYTHIHKCIHWQDLSIHTHTHSHKYTHIISNRGTAVVVWSPSESQKCDRVYQLVLKQPRGTFWHRV